MVLRPRLAAETVDNGGRTRAKTILQGRPVSRLHSHSEPRYQLGWLLDCTFGRSFQRKAVGDPRNPSVRRRTCVRRSHRNTPGVALLALTRPSLRKAFHRGE